MSLSASSHNIRVKNLIPQMWFCSMYSPTSSLAWRNFGQLIGTPCRHLRAQQGILAHTHTIWQKAKCGLRRNQPAGHNTHENWLDYDLWRLFVWFSAVRGTHAWDRLQGCCQGQSNVLGFSIFLGACQKDSTPAGVPVRTSGSMNINRILTPPKQILQKFLWSVEDCTYTPHTCSWSYLHISCVHKISFYDCL